MHQTRSNSRGFTLVELLIVMVIIALLVAIAVPALVTAMEKSRQRTSMANMRSVGNQLQIYQNDTTQFPAGTLTISQVAAVLLPVSRTPIPIEDAWKNEFDYQSDGLASYTLESFGQLGIPGADISPAQANNFELDIVFSDGQFIAAVN